MVRPAQRRAAVRGAQATFALGAARIGHAGLAKGISVAAASGAQASAMRASVKQAFRLGLAKGFRQPDLARYATDEALRAAAGRTNPFVNAYGAFVGAVGAANGTGAGCH